ncbi:MAG: helix-turn-helix domain-containing protein [Erythrobacter sp.]
MAGLLYSSPGVRQANRVLAALVALISLRLLIYVFGFAGVYDDHPSIIFAPLDASLAFGPLLWLYVWRLTKATLPRRLLWHFAPVGLQLLYLLVAFALPVETKVRWYGTVHLDWIEPVGLIANLVSGCCYAALAWRRQQAYQQWLDERFADRDQWRLGWITAILLAFAVTVSIAAAAALVNAAVTPLDYFSRTPVVIATSLLAYVLGLLGWRHSALALPAQEEAPASTKAEAQAASTEPSRPAAEFAQWAEVIDTRQWWREEGLTLGDVARRLGTSTRTLSRALSEGAGCNFNTFINGLRVEAVKRALLAGRSEDLLTLALESGFNSKASFNRAFLRHTGMTPSRWRSTASQEPPIAPLGER